MNGLPADGDGRESRREGRRLAVDGLLRATLAGRRPAAGGLALARLRAEHRPPAEPDARTATARIRAAAAAARARGPARTATASLRRAPAPRRSALIQGAWAAATLVAVVLVLVLAGHPSPPADDLRVVAVGGTVIVGADDQAVALREGMTLRRGDVLATGVNSFVRLLWSDGTLLECAAGTRLDLLRAGDGRRLRLGAGRLEAMVAPPAAAPPLRILGDDVEVVVTGSRVTCTVHSDGMLVVVERGQAAVRRLHDDERAEVPAGQQVAVGASGALQTEVTRVAAASAVAAVGTGLFGQYFDDDQLTEPVFSRIDRDIYFNFGVDRSPDPRIAPSRYSIRWTGELQPKVTGRHAIICQVDDGVRIRLGGRLLISDWRIYEPRWLRAEVDLEAGHRYPLEVEYFQDRDRAIVQLWWQAKGVPQEIIPTANLFPVRPAGVAGE